MTGYACSVERNCNVMAETDRAEIELSVLGRQCLSRRIPDQQTLRDEVAPWQKARGDSPPPTLASNSRDSAHRLLCNGVLGRNS